MMDRIIYILGRDKHWKVGGKTVYLWPFVAFALIIVGMVVFDLCLG